MRLKLNTSRIRHLTNQIDFNNVHPDKSSTDEKNYGCQNC